MPAALQCPDCGHQEMLENVGREATFRCGGCGRALKVPAQFRAARRDPGEVGAPRSQSPVERTQAMPKVPPLAPTHAAPGAQVPIVPPGGGWPAVGGATAGAAAGATPEPRHPPLILRLALWVIALPLGSIIVFGLASSFGVLTKSQLEDTFLLAGWGRFIPIARLLPFCALATALIVQLGEFGLEQLRARNLRNRRRGGPPGRRGPGAGPRRPMSPNGQGDRAANGARSRERVVS